MLPPHSTPHFLHLQHRPALCKALRGGTPRKLWTGAGEGELRPPTAMHTRAEHRPAQAAFANAVMPIPNTPTSKQDSLEMSGREDLNVKVRKCRRC